LLAPEGDLLEGGLVVVNKGERPSLRPRSGLTGAGLWSRTLDTCEGSVADLAVLPDGRVWVAMNVRKPGDPSPQPRIALLLACPALDTERGGLLPGRPSLTHEVGECLCCQALSLLLADEAHSLERLTGPDREQPSIRRGREGGPLNEPLRDPPVQQLARHAARCEQFIGREQVGTVSHDANRIPNFTRAPARPVYG